MKSTIASALVLIGLATAPVAASAAEDAVSYEDAVQCAALFSLLSDASEGSEPAEFEDTAARWLIYAIGRDGTEDGSKAIEDLIAAVMDMSMTLEDAADEAAGEEFLSEGITVCEARYKLVADELDAIEFE